MSTPRTWLSALCAAVVAVTGSATATTASAAAGPAVSAPVDLRVPALAADEHSITLAWSKPDRHAGIVDYHVYRDGHPLGSADSAAGSPARPYIDAFYADPANAAQVRVVASTFTADGLRPGTRYRFTVRSVDSAGHESRDSATLSASTTAVPRVFDVTAYGAVGDGTTLNTQAIQAAIDACAAGGKVVIPAGVFKTGALWLKSDMTLQVAAGGTLLGSERAEDYPWNYKLYDYSTDTRFYSLINAHTYDYGTLHDIRIVGPGTIDGNGWKKNGVDADGFPVSAPSSSATVQTNGILAAAQVTAAAALGSPAPYPTRSNLITLRGVDNVYYGGFTAVNPANHTLVNLHDRNVTVDGVKLETSGVNNADGIEFTNSDGLTVVNTVFDTGDDDLNFAAGLGVASTVDPPSTHAWISGNYFRHGHGAVVEGSHTGAWIENIVAEDNVINGTDVGLRMKTDPHNGGGSRHVLFRDNALTDIGQQAFIFTSAYSDPNAAVVVEPAPVPAVFKDVRVEHVTVDGTGKEAISVVGVADQPHRDLHFDDVRFIHARPASIQFLRDSTFHDVTFDDTPDPWVVKDSTGLLFTGTTPVTVVTADAMSRPSWPAGAVLTAVTDETSATLGWPAATDTTGVPGYRILDGDTTVATVPSGASAYTVKGLAPALTYRFRVLALDATGNTTPRSLDATVRTTGSPDTTAPVVPADAVSVHPGSVGTTWLRLDWGSATDDSGVTQYRIAANGHQVATVPGTTLFTTVTGLRAGTRYTFTVTAVDATGNSTVYPTSPAATTNPPYDTGVPRWPHGAQVRVSRATSTTAALSWPAAVDELGVTGYRVYVDGIPVVTGDPFTPITTAGTTTGTTFTVTGLRPGTAYTVTVEAGDTAGRWTGSGPHTTVRTSR